MLNPRPLSRIFAAYLFLTGISCGPLDEKRHGDASPPSADNELINADGSTEASPTDDASSSEVAIATTPKKPSKPPHLETKPPVKVTPPIEVNPVKIEFAEVAPIIANNCGGGRCHSVGSRHPVYVDNQELVDLDRVIIASEVSGGSMPPNGMPATDKDLLLKYCVQQ